MEWQVGQMTVTYCHDQKGDLLYSFPDQEYFFLSCAEKSCLGAEIL